MPREAKFMVTLILGENLAWDAEYIITEKDDYFTEESKITDEEFQKRAKERIITDIEHSIRNGLNIRTRDMVFVANKILAYNIWQK